MHEEPEAPVLSSFELAVLSVAMIVSGVGGGFVAWLVGWRHPLPALVGGYLSCVALRLWGRDPILRWLRR